jgi:hypothetical protein
MIHFPTDIGQENKTVVLMVTCWKFRQIWNPFFTLFHKYWPDCPYRLIMVTDVGSYPAVQAIQMGSDVSWASNLLNALRQISADRLIIFQDDFLMTAPADTDSVRKLVRYSLDNEVGCLRICPCPGPSGIWKDDFLGVITPNDPIRVSLQLSIWDPEVLVSLMREGESAWDLERNGGKRSLLCTKPFLSLWRLPDNTPGGPIRYFITAVTRGIWEKGALELLGREGIPMDGITERIL